MLRKRFTWRYANGTIVTFPGMRIAARELNVSLTTIRWYAEHDIHSEMDLRDKDMRRKRRKRRVKQV